MAPDVEVVSNTLDLEEKRGPRVASSAGAQKGDGIKSPGQSLTLPTMPREGVWTLAGGREIAMRVVAEALDPKQITVGQAMTGDVLYCFENEPVSDVSEKMADWWVRCLPVVDRTKRLIGMVSLADLVLERRTAPRSADTGIPPRQSRARRPARQTRLRHRRAAAA
jgi:hypothetical protein